MAWSPTTPVDESIQTTTMRTINRHKIHSFVIVEDTNPITTPYRLAVEHKDNLGAPPYAIVYWSKGYDDAGAYVRTSPVQIHVGEGANVATVITRTAEAGSNYATVQKALWDLLALDGVIDVGAIV